MYTNISYQLFKVTQSIYIKKLKQEPKLGSELNWDKTSDTHVTLVYTIFASRLIYK